MHVIGTAGHVDHGKSTLVRALTGIDPDRLREEKERQLTIDLGFAWFTLPGGGDVGIIDVPGHRDFIENMLAGVGGIDAALLVVAADEGIMPQTREHLAILDLLEVDRGLVALTKIDLTQDEEWLALVEEDIRSLIESTSLAGVPIVRVSGRTEQGVERLAAEIETALAGSPGARDLGRPRLPIDRSFTISGFGTVVTGTLLDGTLEIGQEVVIQPAGMTGRIRGLQTHQEEVGRAQPSSRVAVNISGIEAGAVTRGDVLSLPGQDQPSDLLDVELRLLPDSPTAVEHNQEVKVFLGSGQRMARVRLLGREVLHPGESGWLQLLLPEPLVVRWGDRYILRRPSPPITIGGGRVADPHPDRKYRLRDPKVPLQLERLLNGTERDRVLETLRRLGPSPIGAVAKRAELASETVQGALSGLADAGQVRRLAARNPLWIDEERWRSLIQRATQALDKYHARYPLRQGISQEELRSRLGLNPAVFTPALEELEESGVIRGEGDRVALPAFTVELNPEQSEAVEGLLARFQQSPFAPPSVKESEEALGSALYAHLLERGTLRQVSEDVVFEIGAYRKVVEKVSSWIASEGPIRVAEVRDLLRTSRKYALALMEYLDQEGITVREGDVRRLA